MRSQTFIPFHRAAIIGGGAGMLSGVFGVGGGLVTVPCLVAWAGMDRRLAHGTSLAATLPIALAGLVTYLVHGNIDWPVACFLSIGAIAGAIIGTHLLRVVPKNVLIMVFVITVLATATRLLLNSESDGRADLTVTMALLLVGVGVVAGTLAGMLGIGGGVILVPAMVVVLGMAPVVAKGTSVAVIVPTSIMGTIRNRRHANVDIRVAAVIGVCGAVMAVVGATVANGLSDQLSNIMFAALLLFVAITQLLSLRPTPLIDVTDTSFTLETADD